MDLSVGRSGRPEVFLEGVVVTGGPGRAGGGWNYVVGGRPGRLADLGDRWILMMAKTILVGSSVSPRMAHVRTAASGPRAAGDGSSRAAGRRRRKKGPKMPDTVPRS